MTLIKMDLPEIAFYGDNNLAKAAKRSYDLYAPLGKGGVLPYGYKPLPAALTFEKIQFSLQSSGDPSWEVPAGFAGRVAVFVDPDGRYEEEVDYPAQEDGHPRGLIPLGVMPIAPGRANFIQPQDCLLGPTSFRPGDRLGVAIETNQGPGSPHAGKLLSVFASPVFSAVGRERLLEFDTNVVRAVPLNGSYAGTHPFYRSTVPAIRQGGTEIELRFAAREHGMVIVSAGVGVQAAPDSPHMKAPPVPLGFAGAAGAVVPAWTEVFGRASLPLAAGDTVLVDLEFSGCFAFKGVSVPNGSPTPGSRSGRSWYSTASSRTSATMLGTPMQDYGVKQRTYGFDCVRVS